MNGLVFVGGLLGVGIGFPFLIFQIGKCSARYNLKKNIERLEGLKNASSEEINALIEIHLQELRKIDSGLFLDKSKKEK